MEFGDGGLPLHLAPANGFPPEAYRPLAAALAPQIRTLGYRPRPLWPGSDPASISSWRDLTDDMLSDMGRRGDGPFIGAGHSLGGIMTLYAALRRPDLFRGLALIDPVVMPRHMLPVLWAMRQIGQHHRSPIAQGAARRRHRFASANEARARYTGRGAFADLDAAALDGYLDGGLRSDGDGVTLAWPREWEARIFSLVPIDTWDALARLRIPLLIIRGTRSDLLTDRSWRQLQRRLPAARLVELDGGHMVPLERPAAVAETIISWAAGLSRG
ncbi:alpha/beta fold hydrolase [Oscillochloris sp. ZM17-4]|uniref:alpha/beta fold hydrolase n=1 Tax=Oscillochloris sp. ZM17-4 TaxID=2866714 RepID=UPI002108110E|nr:alpha/beta hydrolase [Oscillochloris sp. ZM17-4]